MMRLKKKDFLMFIEFHPSEETRDAHIDVIRNIEGMGFDCLTATKEYVTTRTVNGRSKKTIERRHTPGISIKQLYSDDFFMQVGGCEVLLYTATYQWS